jgi:hypothetical protein
MKARRLTLILAVVTGLVLAFSAPESLRQAWQRGGFYLFSRDFIEDIPRRLTGPGRFRFILQPLLASILGFRSGRADARAGRPPYMTGVLFHAGQRRELIASSFWAVVNLLLMGILMDSIFQWVILGSSYPGAALVVGPVLIVLPYTAVRDLSNRVRPSPAP